MLLYFDTPHWSRYHSEEISPTEPLTELGVGATHQYSRSPLCLFLNKECPQKMQIDSKVVRTHQFFQSEEESESDKSKGSNVVITTHQFLPPLLPPALSLRLKKHIWNISKCHQMTYFLFKFLIPNLKKKYFFLFYSSPFEGVYSHFPVEILFQEKPVRLQVLTRGFWKTPYVCELGSTRTKIWLISPFYHYNQMSITLNSLKKKTFLNYEGSASGKY